MLIFYFSVKLKTHVAELVDACGLKPHSLRV